MSMSVLKYFTKCFLYARCDWQKEEMGRWTELQYRLHKYRTCYGIGIMDMKILLTILICATAVNGQGNQPPNIGDCTFTFFIARRYAVQHYVQNCQSVCPTVRVCRTRLAKILALISGRFAFGQQSWASCSHTDDSSATKQCKLVPVKAQRCTAAGKVTVHRTSHWLICGTYYTYGVSGRSKNWKIGGKGNVPSLLPVLSLTRPFPAANAKRPP